MRQEEVRTGGGMEPCSPSNFQLPGSMQRGCGAPDGTTWRVEAKSLFITTLGESKRKIYPLGCTRQYPEWWFTSLHGSWLLTSVVQSRWWAPVFVILQIWSETQAGMREAQKHPQLVPHKGEAHNTRFPPSCPPQAAVTQARKGSRDPSLQAKPCSYICIEVGTCLCPCCESLCSGGWCLFPVTI